MQTEASAKRVIDVVNQAIFGCEGARDGESGTECTCVKTSLLLICEGK